jgi:hypothetical protein
MCHDSAAAHEREAGAPEQAIEITPEMIEAGILELREKCIGEDLAGIVTDVFYVMLAARAGTLPAPVPHDI